MSAQTESLIKELLEKPITVAIYGGGFKPPTKGHFTVVQKTLEDFPEIDELKIFVGGGVRDGITQEESIKVWEIYKPYLSDKITIEPSVAPVKSVLGYAKEHPDEKVYWVLGAREGDEDDLKDIKSRTKSIEKYPNIEVKVITTAGGVSGTKTRAAISSGNKEQFLHMIPDIDHRQQDQIWNILSPIIKESLIDNIKSKLSDFIKAAKQEGKETKQALSLLIKAAKGDIELTDEQNQFIKDQMIDVLKSLGLVAIAVMPAGSLVALLLKALKLSSFITPSAFVNEIGDASAKIYPFTSDKSLKQIMDDAVDWKNKGLSERYYTEELKYRFKTDKANYIVTFYIWMEKKTYINFSGTPDWKPGPPFDTVVQVGFTTEGNPDDKITNLNEQFSVLSTITKIILEFVDKFNKEGGNIKKVHVAPKDESSKVTKIDSKRGKFYYAYIKKNISKIPGYEVREGKSSDGHEYIEIYKTSNPTLNEGKQVGPLYHYTSANGLKGILQSNRINASEENYLGNELYYISFTRNKNFHKKGSKFGVKTEYRITLDGDKLSNKYKIRPFAYIPGWDIEDSWELDWLDDEPESVRRDFFNATGDYDEQEERIFFKNENGGIDNIKNYILAVDKVEDLAEASDPQAGTALPYGSGFAPLKEIYQFKVSDKNYDEEDNSLISVDYEFSTPDNDYRVEFNSGEYSPESKTFDVSFGLNKYGSKLDTFQMTGEGNALSILKTIVDIIKDFTNRFEVNKLVINPTSEKRGKVYSMVLKALPQDILNKVELVKETKSDPFGLNEIAKELGTQVGKDLLKTWNPKESFVSLCKYMIDNGMNIKPLPKIKVIDNDAKNASNLLGKTAYYDPNNKSITLYTLGRHPKDILRSFAHEMIHHEQNLNGQLKNITTQNTNEDGNLSEIEKEAYEKGNMMLRNWEDNIKNV